MWQHAGLRLVSIYCSGPIIVGLELREQTAWLRLNLLVSDCSCLHAIPKTGGWPDSALHVPTTLYVNNMTWFVYKDVLKLPHRPRELYSWLSTLRQVSVFHIFIEHTVPQVVHCPLVNVIAVDTTHFGTGGDRCRFTEG